MPNANILTITTDLSSCDSTAIDINRTVNDLQFLYRNISNLTLNSFWNISILNFNCTDDSNNSFKQILTFTQAVSIRVQSLFASVYYEYINTKNYLLNGLDINRESLFTLSSVTVNNNFTTNACSSAEIAQDPLCSINMTRSLCTVLPNPWNYNCSQSVISTTSSSIEPTSSLEIAIISTGLGSWQIGLICSLSILFVLSLLLLSGYFYRRYHHSKQLVLSSINVYDDVKLTKKTGIPQGEAFQRAATVVQPKSNKQTTISWIHDDHGKQTIRNDENYINIKSPAPYNQVTFVDHAKVYDPSFPPYSTSPLARKKPNLTFVSLSGTSFSEFKSMMNGLSENKLNDYDSISLNRFPNKLNSPISSQYINPAFNDENLTDEDAWMSILDVVNSELAKLNEQERTRVFM